MKHKVAHKGVLTPQKRFCKMCEKPFLIKSLRNKEQVYCSANCRKKFWLEKQIIKVCPQCGYKIK